LQPGHSPDRELSSAKLKLLLNVFILFYQPLGPIILGFGLKPVGSSGNPFQLLGVLFSLVVLLVNLDALFYDVHGKL